MKKLLFLIVLMTTVCFYGQKVQSYAPWANDAMSKNNNNPTLEEVTKSAEDYFKTIDPNKKGSGLKPFERWKYHWSFFLDENGRVQPKENLWRAWEEKNQMNGSQNRLNDVSNWTSIGPFSNSNTYSASSLQQTGQGRINTIAVDPNNPNTYYVGAPAGGIWKSIDAGVNWTPLTDYLPQIGVSGIAIDHTNSNIIYIATGDDDANDSSAVGVWKSIDGGATWNNTGSLTGNPNSMNEIYIYPNNANTIIVATSSGVHKSTDGGTTWIRKYSGNVRGLKMRPGDSNIWYAVTSNQVYRSTDSGETFQRVTINGFNGNTRLEIEVTPANPDYVYVVRAVAGNAFGGIFKSTNSGASFTRTNETSDIFRSTQAWYDLALTVSDTDEDIIFVGVLDVWKSTDGGDDFFQLNQWNNPNTDSYTHADIHFMRYINGKLFAGTDGGVYISENDGTKFTDLTENLAISQFYKVSVSPQNSSNIVGGIQDNGGYAFNDNQWRNYHGGDGMEGVAHPTEPNTHYGFTQFGGNLYRTTNGGRSNVRVTSSPNQGEWVTPLALDSQGEIYAGYLQLYKIVGNSWSAVSNQSFGGNIDHIEIDPNDENNMYVAQSNRLYRSTDKGSTFSQLSFSSGTVRSIEVSHNDSNTAWVVVTNGVYKTTNFLDVTPTFTNITGNLPGESKLIIKHHERSGNNTIYLGTALGVYYINDDITEWETFDNNLPNVAVRDMDINEEDSKLIAGTYGRGIFTSDIPRQLPPVDVKVISIQNPTGINCNTNFTPQVIIKNQGADVLTSATINYNFDGGTNQVYNWSGSLNSEENILVSIPQVSQDLGLHIINIEVTTANDTYDTNNNISSSFVINSTSTNPTTINSFENTGDILASEDLDTGGSLWEVTTPNKTLLNTAGTGTLAYVTGASGNYPHNTTSYLYTNCYDLTQISTAVLSFKMAFDIEQDWDYMLVEYSTDQGGNWQTLGSASDPNWYNSSSTLNGIPGNQWTGEGEDSNPLGGTNATVHDYSYDLGAFTSESNMIFRFKLVTDQAQAEEGVMIDDLVITGTLSANSEEFSNIVSIYPNPSNSIFNVQWPNNEKTTISVYNYLGQKIMEHKNIIEGFHSLDMSNQSKGLYILKISSDGKTASKKIILQ